MFENFPYTDIHQLNLDWIANVAKNFLDQYTNIQQMIADGETSLDNKTAAGLASLQAEKERLEGLLNTWYISHSEDIASELATAISSFRTAAEAIGAEVEASLPADWTELNNSFDSVTEKLNRATVTNGLTGSTNGVSYSENSGNLVLYGTATASRYILFLNGNEGSRTSGSTVFVQTLPAGTYLLSSSISGTADIYSIYATESTFSEGEQILTSTHNTNVVTFENPVMIGIQTVDQRNYGTSEAPTTITISVKELSAVDFTARENIEQISDAMESIVDEVNVDLSIFDLSTWILITSGTWVDTEGDSRGLVIPIPKNAVSMQVSNGVIACLKTCVPVASELADFSENWSRTTVSELTTYQLDEDCNYLYITMVNTSGVDIAPNTLKFWCVKDENGPILYPIDNETNDETSKTDRTIDIISKLLVYGKCELVKGVYYTSGDIIMPDGSMLTGQGSDTVLKLLDSSGMASTIYMGSQCTVKDITIKGGQSSGRLTDNYRNGIEWTGENIEHGTVDNCTIINFDGAGIKLHDTTTKTYRNLSISNCYISGCHYGIDIQKNSEFNRISNCTICANYYGYRNRGGNNNISNCGIDANTIGIQIDNTEGSNNGHGTITGCSINHSGNNTGYGIIIEGTGRMLVSNCNLYFSKILLNDTNGNVFTGCGFGSDADWEITDGECNIFNGCMVKSWDTDGTVVTITNNTDTKIVNCFDRNGVASS